MKRLTDNELEENKENIRDEIINDVKKELSDAKKNIKDDIIKEIRFEANTVVKDDIKEQLVIDVKNEIKDNIRKEQRLIIRHKNFKLFKKNILILLLLGVAGYFGYCLWDIRYFDFMKDKNTKIVVEKSETIEELSEPEEPEEEIIIKDKNWYISNYGYLLDNMKLNLSMDNYNIYYLYTGDYNITTMKDTIKLNLAYKFVDNKNETDYSYTITEDDMKNAYVKVFGTLDNYNPSSFTVGCMQFYYNGYDQIYTAYKFECEDYNQLHIKEEIKDMYEENDKIIIETVMGVYSDSKYLFKYDNLYNAVVVDFDDSKSVMEYEDKLNTYKYTFKKIDDNYYFESVVKTK